MKSPATPMDSFPPQIAQITLWCEKMIAKTRLLDLIDLNALPLHRSKGSKQPCELISSLRMVNARISRQVVSDMRRSPTVMATFL